MHALLFAHLCNECRRQVHGWWVEDHMPNTIMHASQNIEISIVNCIVAWYLCSYQCTCMFLKLAELPNLERFRGFTFLFFAGVADHTYIGGNPPPSLRVFEHLIARYLNTPSHLHLQALRRIRHLHWHPLVRSRVSRHRIR